MVTRAAFSLIELLVVVSIIAVLSALIVASTGAFSGDSKQARTDAILGALRSALELTLADSGAAAAPAEHPLAASRETRAAFVRRASGGAVATTGLALTGVPLDQVAAGARSRVLLADDVFADASAPHLYGMERGWLSILGVPQSAVTRYRRLPTTITAATDPNDTAILPDHLHLVAPTGTPDQHAAHIDRLLGAAGGSELAALGALRTPGEEFTYPLVQGRLLTDIAPGGGHQEWDGGRIQDGTVAGNPAWKTYRLPGLAIYDGWGSEVLYRIHRGSVTVMSAGKDRAFRWDPGADGTLATAANANEPAGDDRDGRTDNRVQGMGD